MKFVGLALGAPSDNPAMFEYFLDPKNHKPGVPLDMISYHFYAAPSPDQTPEIQQYTFFAQADGFLNSVRYIEAIRKRLSPKTGTTVDEIGCISADDSDQDRPGHITKPIPDSYWNLCAATYTYVFGNLAMLGIDAAGESQLVGYPTQYPSVTMVDWKTGAPNARFRVLELLKDTFGRGEKIVRSKNHSSDVYALAFLTHGGGRKLLLVNKRDREIEFVLPEKAARIQPIDQKTRENPPKTQLVASETLHLHGFEVAVVTFE